MSFQIAIDGPVAAGKSTIARLVAIRLGFLFVDTGAMYRCVALLAQKNNIELHDEQKLFGILEHSYIELHKPEVMEDDCRRITVILNGEDVSWAIRSEEISEKTALVAQLPSIRKELVRKQQAIARNNNVVMEGRDITFRVLPDAQLKIYLNASIEVRAKRDYQEYLERGVDMDIEKVRQEIMNRDKLDMERKIDPLHITEDAWVFDTSNLTIQEVVETIVVRAKHIQETGE